MSPPPRPVARSDGLIVTEAGGDTLVYDLATHRAHSLDPAAARLWRLCDGTRDVAAVAAAAGTSEEIARYGLARLSAVGLVVGAPSDAAPISRRALLRRAAAVGATVVLPVVLSVIAPTTLQSQASAGCKGVPCINALSCCALHPMCTGRPDDPKPGQCV